MAEGTVPVCIAFVNCQNCRFWDFHSLTTALMVDERMCVAQCRAHEENPRKSPRVTQVSGQVPVFTPADASCQAFELSDDYRSLLETYSLSSVRWRLPVLQ